MSLPLMLRLAIPLALALASATVFFRALVLLVVATAFLAILAFLVRMQWAVERPALPDRMGSQGTAVKGFVEGRYKIVDEE